MAIIIGSAKRDRKKASRDITNALSQGCWKYIIDTVKEKPEIAGIWAPKPGAAKAGDMLRKVEKDAVQRIEPNIRGLPIHNACHIGAPTKVIDALVRAYPEGAAQKELDMKRLPLHLAAIFLGHKSNNFKPTQEQIESKEQVIERLIEHYPSGILDGDKSLRTPLHYALHSGASEPIIQSMVRTEPDVAKAQDIDGYTPLHLACKKGYSARIICTLLHYYPSSVLLVTGKDGYTAEHFCRKTKKYDADTKRDVLQLLSHYRCIAEDNFPTAMDPSSVRYIV